MRLLICAGGTGGGVYPALAVLSALSNQSETLWVGGEGGMEADLVKRAGIPFEAIPAAGVHGVGLRALPGNLGQLGRGVFAAQRVLRRFRPDVLFSTGGYVAMPVAAASHLPFRGFRRPRLALFTPDIEPGLALKALTRFADRIAVTAEEACRFYPRRERVILTGYPTRPDLQSWAARLPDRSAAHQALGLSPDLPTLLVVGGSTGAQSINRAVFPALPDLLALAQVVHLTGSPDWPQAQSIHNRLSPDQAARYHPYPYLHEQMGAAYAAAELVISRSGASTLGELPLFGLPAVLVPYPYAWRYQQVNASYLVERGAAVVVADSDLPAQILPVVSSLIYDPDRRKQMRQAMQSLSRPEAAGSIASLLQNLADGRDLERM